MITPWLSQKIEAIDFPAEETFLAFLRGVGQGLHTLLCLPSVKVMEPKLILGHNSTHISQRDGGYLEIKPALPSASILGGHLAETLDPCCKKKTHPKGFNEIVMNFFRGHTLLTEVLYDCSNFNCDFVQFLSLTLPSPLCSEFLLKSIALKFCSFYQRCWIRQNCQLNGVSFHFFHSTYIRLDRTS